MQITKPGLYTMPMAEYVRDPAPRPSLNASVAHVMTTQSALHAWHAHPRLNPAWTPDATEATDLGSIAHAILIEGDRSKIVVVDAADWRTAAAKTKRDEARADARLPILAGRMADVDAMVAVAKRKLEEASELDHASLTDVEKVLLWRDDEIWLRARPDWLSKDRRVAVDYKTTTETAEPDEWARGPMVRHGSDLQAALALHGIFSMFRPKDCAYVFMVQETFPPYAVSLVSLAPAYLEFAQRRLSSAISQWKYCLESNVWPGYPKEICYAEPPAWRTMAWELRAMITGGEERP